MSEIYGIHAVTAALEKRGMSLVAEGTYTRNTTAVKSALIKIRKERIMPIQTTKPK